MVTNCKREFDVDLLSENADLVFIDANDLHRIIIIIIIIVFKIVSKPRLRLRFTRRSSCRIPCHLKALPRKDWLRGGLDYNRLQNS